MTLKEQIMKLQTYKMFKEDDTIYVERDEVLKLLEQQLRDCKTCKHSDNGKCAYTEECHECMWENKYEQQPCEDAISRQAVSKLLNDGWIKGIYPRDAIMALPSVTPKFTDTEI